MQEMTTRIPFLDLGRLNAPYMDRCSRATERVIRSGRYIGGPEVEDFERELAAYQSIPYVVGVSNGLDALTLIFDALIQAGRLAPGDEVIVPANTYIASILAVSRAGLVPVPVEPSSDTLNLDTALVEQALTPRTRAVMPVHLYGRVCWDARLADTVRRHSLIVVEDNAQAIGARATHPGIDGGIMAGSLGHAAAFSFYPTKNLGAMGDAGAVATRDPELARTVRALANYGSDRRYHNIYRGYNCRLDPMQAAILRVKLPMLDRDNDRRRDIAALYGRLVDNPAVKLSLVQPESSTNYHQLIALCDRRDDLRAHLDSLGIGTDIHYAVPPHRQPCYDDGSPLGRYTLPVTDSLAARVLSLPIAPYLTDADIHTVADAINSFK